MRAARPPDRMPIPRASKKAFTLPSSPFRFFPEPIPTESLHNKCFIIIARFGRSVNQLQLDLVSKFFNLPYFFLNPQKIFRIPYPRSPSRNTLSGGSDRGKTCPVRSQKKKNPTDGNSRKSRTKTSFFSKNGSKTKLFPPQTISDRALANSRIRSVFSYFGASPDAFRNFDCVRP